MGMSSGFSRFFCAAIGGAVIASPAFGAPMDCGIVNYQVRPWIHARSPVVPRPTTDAELLNLNAKGGTFAASATLDNAGWIDGVYECDVTLGGTTERVLVSMNGKADGATIYAVASMKTHYEAGRTTPSKPIDQPFRGYGIGAITGAGYTGTTWNGQPFSFTLLGLAESTSQKKYDVLRIKGSIGIDANRTAQLVCKTDRALF